MARTRIVVKLVSMLSLGGSVMVGSCLPDNTYANILGSSLMTGTVEAIRNTVLVALNLQTP